MRIGVFEQHAIADESIDVRSLGRLIAVRRQPIRAERVDGDDNDRPVGWRGDAMGPPEPHGEAQNQHAGGGDSRPMWSTLQGHVPITTITTFTTITTSAEWLRDRRPSTKLRATPSHVE